MANIPIYNGSPSWATGLTPFGFYDNDPDFPGLRHNEFADA